MAPGWLTIWKALLIALATLVTSPAWAQAGIVGSELHVCVARVAAGDTPRIMLASPARFDCRTPQHRLGPGDYWAMSVPPADVATAGRGLRIRQSSLWQNELALYARYADGRIVGTSNDGVGISRHIRMGAIIEHRLATRGVPIDRLLWRIGGSANMRGIVVGVRIADDAASIRSDLLLMALYGGFVGLCFALLIYNLALWKALRHRFQLDYCAMLLFLMIYALSSSGALAWIAPDMPNTSRITLNYVSLSWAAAAALAFSRHFFEDRVFEGWLARAVEASAITLLILGAAFLVATPVDIRVVDRAYSVAFASLPFIILPVLWRAWRRRSNHLWLFSLTWASPMVMVVARGMANLNLVGWSFLLDNSTLLAMAVEALMTSLAIAYRFSLLSRERDAAIRREAITRELADTDPLTGLLNRRAFMAQVAAIDRPCMLMLFDIDHFKQVNDTIGHDGGDEVLRVVAQILRTHANGALVARMGGEEFALLGDPRLLPDPETILTAVRTHPMPFDLRVTTSIGICQGPLADEAAWKRLYRRADQALFEAKASGRDRIRHAGTLAIAA